MTINYSKQAIKFLSKQDKMTRIRIAEAIKKLPQGDVKKLQGQVNYRLRVGDYRVIFNKIGDILYIEKIDNCGQIYK
ncbi:MAG: type II toxin-antitoxin system RelE/ParE family toxin [Bacillus sp. (in: Bacteria)]|nr:type II toxin-antitoxin system RelE/ParE family toxin [Bacillus sp. (in: firmicutes)]MCM1427919.1 type II toxin-antitoxin system RelE/ParE family toxin [Eubacterium sp.]